MPLFDLPLDELEKYKPERNEPVDYESFWKDSISSSRQFELDAHFTEIQSPLQTLQVFDLEFSGFRGQRIKGWFLRPQNSTLRLPCIIEYLGYGDGRGFPIDHLLWASLGYCHLVMDSRGQGSNGFPGDTPDWMDTPDGSQYPGFVTRGILNPADYYYRRLFTDAVLAVDAAGSSSMVDPNRIFVSGRSQGGGIALAVTGLAPNIRAALIDVPFNCHYRRATEISDRMPYQEIALYCKTHRDQVERVFQTLSYFDGMNFAAHASAPALFSTGLMDVICPPSTIYAAFNHYAGPKEICAYPFNEHDAGLSFQTRKQIEFIHRYV
jgi:cephalosporin-C deacetylase